jgi:hypothetical protein
MASLPSSKGDSIPEFGKVLRGATIADRGSFESFSTDRTFEVSSPVCEKLERHFSCVGDL